MRSIHLLENLEFSDSGAHAQPLLANPENRIIRFLLKPGQTLKEHSAPSSDVIIVVLQGRGIFSGREGQSRELGPNTLVSYDQGEPHSVHALAEELIFLAILKGSPDSSAKSVGLMAGDE